MKKIDRILQYIDEQGIALSEFERNSGLGNTYFTNTKKRNADVTYKSLMKIKENQPEHYYKIFPEEKSAAEITIPRLKDVTLPDDECFELRIEVGFLRKRIEDLERTIEDKMYIINLQKGLIQYERKASG